MHNGLADQIRRLVEDAMKAEGLGARRFEEKHGLKPWALRGLLDPERKQSPSIDKAKEIVEALGLELSLAPRKSTIHQAGPTEFAAVPLYDVNMAAGSGFLNDSEAVIGHLSFRRDWLKKIGASLPSLILGRAKGPSMEPTIWDSDPVLLDTSKREVPVFTPTRRKKGPVFSFLHDGEARIKRILRFKNGAAMLVSDNPEFPPEPVDLKQLQIVGRALWWSHTDLE